MDSAGEIIIVMEIFAVQKDTLRKRVRKELGRLSAEEVARRSRAACQLLVRQAVWRRARSILFYAPLPRELDIWPLMERALREGRIAALPRYSAAQGDYVASWVQDPVNDVRTGRFGIREPLETCATLELNRLDLVLVPGVAFDLDGKRLGRGKGHYDRLLSSVRSKTCGVAFDEQVVEKVPVEAHDVLLNCILTPTRWLEL